MVRWDYRLRLAIAICGGLSVGPGSPMIAADHKTPRTESSAGLSRMNCGAQIECITPNGQFGRISRLPSRDRNAAALIMEDDTVACVLQEGETNFVIELPKAAGPDRFTFVNENGKARGELRISVSDHRLAPHSSEWKDVEGAIPFVHKRLFGVSLLGIEAKYVRLSFRVEVPTSSHDLDGLTNTVQSSEPSVVFWASALQEGLNSPLAPDRNPNPVLLSALSDTVAPLSIAGN
jgi:hypothetical protein